MTPQELSQAIPRSALDDGILYCSVHDIRRVLEREVCRAYCDASGFSDVAGGVYVQRVLKDLYTDRGAKFGVVLANQPNPSSTRVQAWRVARVCECIVRCVSDARVQGLKDGAP